MLCSVNWLVGYLLLYVVCSNSRDMCVTYVLMMWLSILSAAPSSAELLNWPFQCCVLPSLVSEEGGDFLQGLKAELLALEFFEKNNDLYQFSQVSLLVLVPVWAT